MMGEMNNVDLAAIEDRFLTGQHDEADLKHLKLYETLSRYVNRPGCNLQIPVPGKLMEIVFGAETYGGIHFRIKITDEQAEGLLRQALENLGENWQKVDAGLASLIPVTACINKENPDATKPTQR